MAMARGHLSLGRLSPMGFKCKKRNPLDPPGQDTLVPCIPCEQTLWKLTPGPIGTRWSEDLFREPYQCDEPPIPGLSQSSESQVPSHEDASTHEPEPEVAPTQSMEDSFGKFSLSFFSFSQHSLTLPLTISSLSRYPPSIIIIENTPVGSPSTSLFPDL
ncbi:hypothetical protein O181_067334 [Austropuccinia psidii MF-1]|uniref:Uncharacterized protein n=1 Tax=Austropuccinia psidii MF-1 TaxID=1389203 RepID=A0A9Q3I6E9_9BASI|nr:hypothetical protein [Austropuccinia psidii MF-1]